MYRKTLMLLVAVIFLSSVIQSAAAFEIPRPAVPQGAAGSQILAGWPFVNKTLNDLRVQRTKTVTINGIDRAINSLGAIEAGVERSRLTDGQKASIKSRIAENVSWFEAKKADVKASTDVASILQYAKDASTRWSDVNSALKKEIGLMACDNLDGVIATARTASTVASSKIEALKARGKETGNIEKALADFNGHIDNAARDTADARSEFNAISPKAFDGHYTAGLKRVVSAQTEIKNAYADLKTIYRLLYGSGIKID